MTISNITKDKMTNTHELLIERNKELEHKEFPKLISKIKKWLEEEGRNTEEYYLVANDGSLHYGRRERTDYLDTFTYVQELIRATQYLDKRHWEWHWKKIEEITVLKKEKQAENEKHALEIEELKEKQEELEKRIEELEEEVQMEREEAAKALEVSRLERWEPKVSLFVETIKAKEDDLEEASERIKLLENFVAWQNYVAKKQLQELPVLPKKTNKFKLLSSKVRRKVNQTKEVVKEKFDTYILQKNK